MNDVFEKIDLNSVDWKSSREFFESLVDELQKLDNKDESYNFTWVGKRKSIIEAGRPIEKILRPDVEASKDFDKTKNMLIVGDNLDALKLLQESYLGKIKLIYIDPPYNTGHDFVYHDNFTVKRSDYIDNTTDEDGNILISEDEYRENSEANGRFHSDWLSMIYPRLKLARNLLSDDGVIFISIDDNELVNLEKVCQEIFYDYNVETMVWDKITGNDNAGSGKMKITYRFRRDHEYVVVVYKDKNNCIFNKPLRMRQVKNQYGNADNDPRGNWISSEICKSEEKSNPKGKNYFTLTGPDGITFTRQWHYSKEELNDLIADNRIYFGKNGSIPRLKKFLSEPAPITPSSVINKMSSQTDANRELAELGLPFENPKPVNLLSWLLKIGSNKDSIILDFFAGSGTIGHAVMDLNAEDGGKRQYICVQLDEKTDEKSEAKKAGYDTIDQITAERLRRAGNKIESEHPEADIDTGFRVFRVDSNNENKDIRKPLNQINQSDLFNAIDNIKKDRTPLDLLFGVVYVSALPFDLKLEAHKIGENTVYLYGYLDEGTGLIACFDDNIPEETIKEIANLKALTAAFKDSSFAGSAAKINLSEHFRIISPDTKVKVL